MRAQILNASAGSGKTYQLAYKYVHDALSEPHLYRHILAVTFTNKATEEMKSRILKELHHLASNMESDYLEPLCHDLRLDAQTIRSRALDVQTRILHDYSHFTVLTIDKFFQRILRAFIRELGIDLNYNIEIETESILSKSADALIEHITTDESLRKWLTEYVRERIEEGAKWDIRDGILSLGDELFKEGNRQAIIDGLNKEELSNVVRRATARAEAAKQNYRKLGERAMEIMRRVGVTPSDFTQKSRSFAHIFSAIASGDVKQPTATAVKMSLTREGWASPATPAASIVAELQPILAEICETYDGVIEACNSAKMMRENFRSFALLTDLYAKVRDLCQKENTLLLSETKHILGKFIADNDAPFIYEKVGNRYERLMIDEFQDTSAKEWQNFLPLLYNAMSQSLSTSVFIVGDIKQSIYRWRGGDWRLLGSKAREDLRHENTHMRTLEENFRSLERIVYFNNEIIERIVNIDNKLLNALLTDAHSQGDLSEKSLNSLIDLLKNAYTKHKQTPRKKAEAEGYVRIETYEEQAPVIECIREVIDQGFRPCDIMILVRGKNEGARIAERLLEFKASNSDARYDFDVMTQEALIIGRSSEVGVIIASMRLAIEPNDKLSRAIYNRHNNRAADAELSEEESAFFRSIRLLSPEEAFERIILRDKSDKREVAYIQALHEQVINFCASRIADLRLFLEWWDEHGCKQSLSVEQSDSTIEIMTIHKSKGLEKRVVILPSCNWSMVPLPESIVWAQADHKGEGQIGDFPMRYLSDMGHSMFSQSYYQEMVYSHIDNVNLLYVALTRAIEALYIYLPRKSSKNKIGKLMLDALNDETLPLRHSTTSAGDDRYESGEQSSPIASKGEQKNLTIKLEDYPTSVADLRLRLPSQRYFEGQQSVELSPRDFGILMHRVFAEAENREEIEVAIKRMQSDGIISQSEAEHLQSAIATALSDPKTKSWFDGSWSQIRNESEIILPNSSSTRRPDRVMIKGDRAVVVDYKFGESDKTKHRQQIADYMQILQQMGYKPVEGYLWYVKLGRTERVD